MVLYFSLIYLYIFNKPSSPFLPSSHPHSLPSSPQAPFRPAYISVLTLLCNQLRIILPEAFARCSASRTTWNPAPDTFPLAMTKYGWNPLSDICPHGGVSCPFLLVFSPAQMCPTPAVMSVFQQFAFQANKLAWQAKAFAVQAWQLEDHPGTQAEVGAGPLHRVVLQPLPGCCGTHVSPHPHK